MVESGFDDVWAQVGKIEVALMPKKTVNVFQIPPVTSAKGHRSEDWRGK